MASEKITKDTNIKEKVVKIEEAKDVLPDKQKARRLNNAYLFGKAFGERLRTDKLFLISFLITLVFIAFFTYKKLRSSESSYPSIFNRLISENEKDKNGDAKGKSNVEVDEKLDISDYVGIYSRIVDLSDKVKLSDNCTIDTYKFVYQVKKDKSITKYLYNSCLGSIKVWSDTLGYVTSGGTKYIGTEKYHFLFSGSSMKEVDGETYRVDDEFVSIKEKNKIDGLYTYFYDNSIVFKSNRNLILLRGNSLLFNLETAYPNSGGKMSKRVYKAKDQMFKFIVFSNGIDANCSDEKTNEDKEAYKIYSITYEDNIADFSKPLEIVTRNINDGCTNWQEDYKILTS